MMQDSQNRDSYLGTASTVPFKSSNDSGR